MKEMRCNRICCFLSCYFPLIFPTDAILNMPMKPMPRLDALRALVVVVENSVQIPKQRFGLTVF